MLLVCSPHLSLGSFVRGLVVAFVSQFVLSSVEPRGGNRNSNETNQLTHIIDHTKPSGIDHNPSIQRSVFNGSPGVFSVSLLVVIPFLDSLADPPRSGSTELASSSTQLTCHCPQLLSLNSAQIQAGFNSTEITPCDQTTARDTIQYQRRLSAIHTTHTQSRTHIYIHIYYIPQRHYPLPRSSTPMVL